MSLANLFRNLEKEGYVMICERGFCYEPHKKLPYFGCMILAKGKKALEAWKK